MVRSLRFAVVFYVLAIHGVCLTQGWIEKFQSARDVECPVARPSYCGVAPNETSYLVTQAAEQNVPKFFRAKYPSS